ncbi:hypothetical protein TraAM80_01493 [Trypanosoma rangeli]|uniref:Roc domain-containing protein n=1 Tax=Trypanosoma rangeli TaxID=5698 RepID=A0A422NYM8_TRYRA|nr:uncharacterized protein TraAM80_01493 [Trypanosoma rangeli]RNF10566.1 hypothetical protein TraAM80_01493 [Trypanosoma rangeli]|eukprot:RNF10566.1 hypothetical protein TraAM80_01493 [Trypanosoma rangeli]
MSFTADAALHSASGGGKMYDFHASQGGTLGETNEDHAVFLTPPSGERGRSHISWSCPLDDDAHASFLQTTAAGTITEDEGRSDRGGCGPLTVNAEEAVAGPFPLPDGTSRETAFVEKIHDQSLINAAPWSDASTALEGRHHRMSPEASSCAKWAKYISTAGVHKNPVDALKLQGVHEKLLWLNVTGMEDLLSRYLINDSVNATHDCHGVSHARCLDAKPHHVDPKWQDSMLQGVQQIEVTEGRLTNKQIFRRKLVLLGYQEVGKTSFRKCLESEPLLLKRLPEVRTTTGVEACRQNIRVGEDWVQLVISDFAGQESYHSHTLFLTDRSIFLLVWKISSVEQDFQGSGICVNEEECLYKWIAEVYAKFPRAKIALVATHLDELRVQEQRSVERILSKVEGKLISFMQRIAITDPNTGTTVTNEIVGNFAVSCKTRQVIAAGELRHLSGQRLSALLRFFAEVAHQECMDDKEFPAAAIPGCDLKLLESVTSKGKEFQHKLLLPLGEFINSAVKLGVKSGDELLRVARLMHSWDIIYFFNAYCLSDNIFIMLRPLWLSRLAAALFSYAHVLRTPLHLRSMIGRLEYTVSVAESADMHLMNKGFLRWPLVRVLFRTPLRDILGHEPDELDYTLAVHFLISLSLVVPVVIPCDKFALLQEETPIDLEVGRPLVREAKFTRYFVPSLSPFNVPERLRRLAPLLFNRGTRLKFEFNLLPDEIWWRFQAQLQGHQKVVVVYEAPGVFADARDGDVLDDRRLLGADEKHNRWRDAMWLAGDYCRVFLYREGFRVIHIFSTETRPHCAQAVLGEVENVMSRLLQDYRGLQRTVQVTCPEQGCNDWLPLSEVLAGTRVTCQTCRHAVSTNDVVAEDVGSRDSCFGDALLREAGELFCLSLNPSYRAQMCEYLCVDRTRVLGASPTDENNHDMGNEEAATWRALDCMCALDKVVRAAMLYELRERVEEEVHRRQLLEPAQPTQCLSFSLN